VSLDLAVRTFRQSTPFLLIVENFIRLASGLIDPADALAQFDSIEPELYRFPAIDPPSFRRSVEELFR
jgi:hypothetical protein